LCAAPLPLGFGGFNTLNFSAWGGDFNAPEWRQLLSEIGRIAGAATPPGMRPQIRWLSGAVAVAAGWGAVIGALTWGLYSLDGSAGPSASLLGHPIIDSFALAFLGSLPIALWSALEVKRAGFDSLELILKRSCSWFLKGGIVALLVLVAAIAAGAVKGTSPREVAGELTRIFVVAMSASACVLTIANLLWFALRRGLGIKPG
jgi:hypothetical protein